MRSLLILGIDASQHKDRYMDLARNFLAMSFDVTAHWIVDEPIEGDFLVDALSKDGIKSWFDLRSFIDWDRMEKELKTHSLIWVMESDLMIHALSLSKVYGRDVWCMLEGHHTSTQNAFLETADYIILKQKEGTEAFDLLMKKLCKKMVLFYDTKSNQCTWYKNGLKRLFDVEFNEHQLTMEGFAIALLSGDVQGEYAAERLRTAISGGILYPFITIEEVERLCPQIKVTELEV